MTSKRILILGGTGFIGSRLLPRLVADGHELVVLTRNRERHRPLAVLPAVTLRSVDVHDPAVLERQLQGMGAAINLVGILNASGRQTFQRVHVELVRSLVGACKAAGVSRLHQMSSLKAGQGLSQYLKSRGDAENIVRQSGLDYTIYQSSAIFGEGDGLVTRFSALLRKTPLLPLARAGSRMAPTWVGDVAEAITRGVADDRISSKRIFELYGPQVLTLGELVRDIRDAGGHGTRILPLPDSLGRLQARMAEWLPGKPFSLDNFRSLRTDSVGKVDGYAALGITPKPFTTSLPQLLAGSLRQHRLDQSRTLRR